MIVSIGEIVWDIFDNRRVLGGAPVNVAYHLHALGLSVEIITRVGPDELAVKTLDKITELGLSSKGVQKDGEYPTGQVVVTIGPNHEPRFDIVDPAAWDNIDLEKALQVADEEPFYLIFGTLAQRHAVSRTTIRALWKRASVRFYDINLRPPFTTRELVLESLTAADVIKMNGEEIARLAEWLDLVGKDKRNVAQELLSRFNLQAGIITEGKAGAWLVVSPDEYFEHPGFPVQVEDTVGAGDAFFAAFIEGYISQRPWADCLARANHRGAFVASQPGATPSMKSYRYNE